MTINGETRPHQHQNANPLHPTAMTASIPATSVNSSTGVAPPPSYRSSYHERYNAPAAVRDPTNHISSSNGPHNGTIQQHASNGRPFHQSDAPRATVSANPDSGSATFNNNATSANSHQQQQLKPRLHGTHSRLITKISLPYFYSHSLCLYLCLLIIPSILFIALIPFVFSRYSAFPGSLWGGVTEGYLLIVEKEMRVDSAASRRGDTGWLSSYWNVEGVSLGEARIMQLAPNDASWKDLHDTTARETSEGLPLQQLMDRNALTASSSIDPANNPTSRSGSMQHEMQLTTEGRIQVEESTLSQDAPTARTISPSGIVSYYLSGRLENKPESPLLYELKDICQVHYFGGTEELQAAKEKCEACFQDILVTVNTSTRQSNIHANDQRMTLGTTEKWPISEMQGSVYDQQIIQSRFLSALYCSLIGAAALLVLLVTGLILSLIFMECYYAPKYSFLTLRNLPEHEVTTSQEAYENLSTSRHLSMDETTTNTSQYDPEFTSHVGSSSRPHSTDFSAIILNSNQEGIQVSHPQHTNIDQFRSETASNNEMDTSLDSITPVYSSSSLLSAKLKKYVREYGKICFRRGFLFAPSLYHSSSIFTVPSPMYRYSLDVSQCDSSEASSTADEDAKRIASGDYWKVLAVSARFPSEKLLYLSKWHGREVFNLALLIRLVILVGSALLGLGMSAAIIYLFYRFDYSMSQSLIPSLFLVVIIAILVRMTLLFVARYVTGSFQKVTIITNHRIVVLHRVHHFNMRAEYLYYDDIEKIVGNDERSQIHVVIKDELSKKLYKNASLRYNSSSEVNAPRKKSQVPYFHHFAHFFKRKGPVECRKVRNIMENQLQQFEAMLHAEQQRFSGESLRCIPPTEEMEQNLGDTEDTQREKPSAHSVWNKVPPLERGESEEVKLGRLILGDVHSNSHNTLASGLSHSDAAEITNMSSASCTANLRTEITGTVDDDLFSFSSEQDEVVTPLYSDTELHGVATPSTT